MATDSGLDADIGGGGSGGSPVLDVTEGGDSEAGPELVAGSGRNLAVRASELQRSFAALGDRIDAVSAATASMQSLLGERLTDHGEQIQRTQAAVGRDFDDHRRQQERALADIEASLGESERNVARLEATASRLLARLEGASATSAQQLADVDAHLAKEIGDATAAVEAAIGDRAADVRRTIGDLQETAAASLRGATERIDELARSVAAHGGGTIAIKESVDAAVVALADAAGAIAERDDEQAERFRQGIAALAERLDTAQPSLAPSDLDPVRTGIDELRDQLREVGRPVDLAPLLEQLGTLGATVAEISERRVDLGPLHDRFAVVDTALADLARRPEAAPTDLTLVLDYLRTLAASTAELSDRLDSAAVGAAVGAAVQERLDEVASALQARLDEVDSAWQGHLGEVAAVGERLDQVAAAVGRLDEVAAVVGRLEDRPEPSAPDMTPVVYGLNELRNELSAAGTPPAPALGVVLAAVSDVQQRLGALAPDATVLAETQGALERIELVVGALADASEDQLALREVADEIAGLRGAVEGSAGSVRSTEVATLLARLEAAAGENDRRADGLARQVTYAMTTATGTVRSASEAAVARIEAATSSYPGEAVPDALARLEEAVGRLAEEPAPIDPAFAARLDHIEARLDEFAAGAAAHQLGDRLNSIDDRLGELAAGAGPGELDDRLNSIDNRLGELAAGALSEAPAPVAQAALLEQVASLAGQVEALRRRLAVRGRSAGLDDASLAALAEAVASRLRTDPGAP